MVMLLMYISCFIHQDKNMQQQLPKIELTFASLETVGLDGNSTLRALIIVSSRNIRS